MSPATDRIGVETVVHGGNDPHAVTVNVHVARSRTAPGEINCLPSVYLVAARSQGDLAWRWRRSRAWRGRPCRQSEGIDFVICGEINPTSSDDPRIPLARSSHYFI